MPPFVSDSFTDTDGTELSLHAGETGATWAKHDLVTANAEITANGRLAASTATAARYLASGTPPTAEYTVSATFRALTVTGNTATYLLARASSSASTHYGARYVGGTTLAWSLFKQVAGVFTSLGTVPATLSADTDYAVELRITDAQKSLWVDGVELLTSADNAITGAGLVGLQIQGPGTSPETTGIHLDNFATADVGAPPQVARPDADVSAGTWTTAPLWSKIDEATASDADLIESSTTSGSTCEVGLSDVTDPTVSTGHVVRYRFSKTANGGSSPSLTVDLVQGTTVRASSGAVAVPDSTAFTDGSFTLTGTEADAITSYTDLRLRFTMTRGGGSGRGARVSWAAFEAPAVAGDATGTVGSGSLAVAGQAVAAQTGASGTVAAGALAVSGQAVAGGIGDLGSVAAGAHAVAGQDVAGVWGAVGVVAVGAQAVVGQAVAGQAGALGGVATGGLAASGQAVAGSVAVAGAVAAGAVAVSGQAVAAQAGALGGVASGGLAIAGQTVAGTEGGVSETGSVATGGHAVAGQAVAGQAGSAGAIAGGAHAVSGQAVAAQAGASGTVAAGSLAVAAQAVGGAAGATGATAAGALAVSGQAVAVRTGSVGAVAAGSLAVSGQPVAGTESGPAVAGTVAAGALAVAGQAVAATTGAVGAVAADALAVAGQDVTGRTGTVGTVATGALDVAGQPVAGWGLIGLPTTPVGGFGAAPRVVAVLVASAPAPAGVFGEAGTADGDPTSAAPVAAGVFAGAGEPRGRFG